MNEMYKILIRNKISPNGLYLLYSIKEKTSTPIINTENVKKILIKNNWLNDDNILTDKSKRLLIEVEGLFKKVKKQTSDKIMGNNYNDKINEYNQLFPKMKLPTGKAARSSINNLENAFRWFFQNHNYDWETIFKATNTYLIERKLQNWKFTRNSQYFIRKQVVDKTWESSLADWCLMIEDGIDEQDTHFKDKVF